MLNEADLVLVPVLALDDVGRAEATVRAHVDHDRVQRVVFAMSDSARPRRPPGTRRPQAAVDAFDDGADTIAFATIGDPNIYSTFTYLAQTVREQLPEVVIETVPGITAMQELAARSGTVLCEGTESLALLPLTAGVDTFEAAIATLRHRRRLQGRPLDRRGRRRPAPRTTGWTDAVYGGALGLDDEQIEPLADYLDGRSDRARPTCRP